MENNCSVDVGEYAIPSEFIVVDDIPETLTGKYMRRIVQKIVQGRDVGDTSSLRNPESIEAIRRAIKDSREPQRKNEIQLADDVVPQTELSTIIDEVQSLVAEITGTKVEPEMPLMHAGLTSIGILQIGRRMKSAFSIDVPVTFIFDYPSVSAIA